MNVQFKIDEKLDDDESKNNIDKTRKKRETGSLLGLINQIQQNRKDNIPNQTKTDVQWVRKALLQELKLFKDDFQYNEELVTKHLQSHIPQNSSVVCMTSFLNNNRIFQKISEKGAKIKQIITEPQRQLKNGQISLKDLPRNIRKANRVCISAELVLKDGGVLSSSGGLMVATVAKHYGVPVIIVTRGYCLSQNLNLSQSHLTVHSNPLDYFGKSIQEEAITNSDFKVYIAKKCDYIPAEYISSIVMQKGSVAPQNIETLRNKYYEEYS